MKKFFVIVTLLVTSLLADQALAAVSLSCKKGKGNSKEQIEVELSNSLKKVTKIKIEGSDLKKGTTFFDKSKINSEDVDLESCEVNEKNNKLTIACPLSDSFENIQIEIDFKDERAEAFVYDFNGDGWERSGKVKFKKEDSCKIK